MENEIMVSVICTAYNHEKYIKECLDGFVSQKTDFKYEVFVHDDASTDGTADIIREYAEKYPDIIKPILQKENQYSKNVYISKQYILPIVKGKYIAFCEGDDYWCDDRKLQKQFDFLEKHTDCYICTHIVQNCEENGKFTNAIMPTNPRDFDNVIESEAFLKSIALSYCFHTCSYFLRTDKVIEYWDNLPKFKIVSGTGDYPYMLYFASIGKIAFINDTMAVHRLQSDSSWSKNYITNSENSTRHFAREVSMFCEYDIYTHFKYHKICETAIDRVTFEYYMRAREYRRAVSIRYWKFLKQYSFKSKLYILYSSVFRK